jgi:hypothetical protein
MLNQVSLPRTGRLFDAAPVVAALRRGLLSLAALAQPPRGSVPVGAESYFEYGLMLRELHRL